MTYQEHKEQARQKAQAAQIDELVQSWEEVAEQGAQLKKLAKKFGLIKELKNNGII